jgi:glutamate--cysteine ligase regulatory subunit
VIRNIISGGPSIVRKPGEFRSNFEFTNSLRSSFVAAQQDYGAETTVNGNGNGVAVNGNGNGAHGGLSHPLSAWTAQEGEVLYVPRIDWEAAGLQEEPSQYDVTVKLFFLPTTEVAQRAQYAREALGLVLKELRLPQVNLLIVSFPGMSFEGDCEWKADQKNAEQGNDDEEYATWTAIEVLQKEGLVRKLGIAEFGSEKLARLLKRVQVRPAVDQINIKNCCNVPPPLVTLAQEQGIELLVHSDCTDILPKGTLRELLGPGPQGAGVLADPETHNGGLQGDLTPEWVVKYTAVVHNRGVIENKGYFAGAELKDC